jgi:hypothetical protein
MTARGTPLVRSQPRPRPGWVYETVVAALAAAGGPLRRQDVIRHAERVHDQRISPSSIRNCLREAASRPEGSIQRLGYGRYQLRARLPE